MPISNSWKTLTWCQESRIVTSTPVTKEACAMVGFADNGRPQFPVHAVSAPPSDLRGPQSSRTQTHTHADARKRLNSMEVVCAGSSLGGRNHCHERCLQWEVALHRHTLSAHTQSRRHADGGGGGGGEGGGHLPKHSLNNLQLSHRLKQTKKNLNAQGLFLFFV